MTLSHWLSVGLLVVITLATSFLAFGNRPDHPNRPRRLRRRKHALPAAPDTRVPELIAAGLLPLAQCPRDHRACLRCLEVDRCILHRLTELGMTPGVELRVVHDAGGPMLVSVRGSRVAIGRDLAEKIWVEVAPPPDIIPEDAAADNQAL